MTISIKEEHIEREIKRIGNMDQFDLGRLLRFCPCGHPYFDEAVADVNVLRDEFFKLFKGMTPKISKHIGLTPDNRTLRILKEIQEQNELPARMRISSGEKRWK